jgi:endonuclease YncB( thermonuclease family)
MWWFWLIALASAQDLGVCWKRCYDGDTCTFDLYNPYRAIPDIFASDISVRVIGVDAPEIRGECALEKCLGNLAKEFTASRLKSSRVKLTNLGRDKYFRILANILYNPKSPPLISCERFEEETARLADDWHDITSELLAAGLAVEYFGDTKVTDWCDYSSKAFYHKYTKVCMSTDPCVNLESSLEVKLSAAQCKQLLK